MGIELKLHRTKEGNPTITAMGDKLAFCLDRPTVIQPSEIIKVQTTTIIKVPQGYLLTIVTAPELYNKAGEVFPACLTIDASSNEQALEIPIRNSSRNQLNLMQGNLIAFGYISKIEDIQIGSLKTEQGNVVQPEKSRPQKKQDGNIKFELT